MPPAHIQACSTSDLLQLLLAEFADIFEQPQGYRHHAPATTAYIYCLTPHRLWFAPTATPNC